MEEKRGRKAKTYIQVSSRWALGIDTMNYTVEEMKSGRWEPVAWYSNIEDACGGLYDRTVKADLVLAFSQGVAKERKKMLAKLLKEASKHGDHIVRTVAPRADVWSL